MGGIFSTPDMPPPPRPIEMPRAPTVDQTTIERDRADMMRRRRGRAATVLTGGDTGGVAAGSVATKTLLGQ